MANTAKTSLRDYTALLATLMLFAGVPATAQVPVDDDGNPITALGADGTPADNESYDGSYDTDVVTLGPAELEELIGPIALYPDDLLAIVLPASTYPLQIVQAARFLEALENDSSLKPDESWDESVVALVNYPDVIRLLNDDIDWTWKLGEAVISQQEDVVAAVESFRDRAYAAGNLKSDERQTVSQNDGIIEIVPIEDDVIYVPYYEPEHVVVRQSRPVYYYYSNPYPVYYYPYARGHQFGHHFSSNYFWGVTTAYRIGWANNLLHVRHPSYWGHPYYGHHYFGHYYRRPSVHFHNSIYYTHARRHARNRYRDGDYWQPRRRSGARPSYYGVHTRHYRADTSSNHRTPRHDNRTARSNRNGSDRRQHRAATTTRAPTFRARPRHEREPQNLDRRSERRNERRNNRRNETRPAIQHTARNNTRRHESRPTIQRTARNNVNRENINREQRLIQTQRPRQVNAANQRRQVPVQRQARATVPRERHQNRAPQQRRTTEPVRRAANSRSNSTHRQAPPRREASRSSNESKPRSSNKAARSERNSGDRKRHSR